jgi:hypothetical protein
MALILGIRLHRPLRVKKSGLPPGSVQAAIAG